MPGYSRLSIRASSPVARVRLLCVMLLAVPCATLAAAEPAYVESGSVAAAEATQAAAADEQFLYAISSTQVAKYDRRSGERLALSTGKASHLNSGYFWEGKLYCAHSNFPKTPAQSELMQLDPATMQLSTYKDFGAAYGSLTWAIRKENRWYCNFAHYGKENHKSVLVAFDNEWNELASWTYPAELVADLDNYSLSGGIWKGDTLIATGHHARKLYHLSLPEEGKVLRLDAVLPGPFPGQGIATDPLSGELIGIDRPQKRIVFAKLRD